MKQKEVSSRQDAPTLSSRGGSCGFPFPPPQPQPKSDRTARRVLRGCSPVTWRDTLHPTLSSSHGPSNPGTFECPEKGMWTNALSRPSYLQISKHSYLQGASGERPQCRPGLSSEPRVDKCRFMAGHPSVSGWKIPRRKHPRSAGFQQDRCWRQAGRSHIIGGARGPHETPDVQGGEFQGN